MDMNLDKIHEDIEAGRERVERGAREPLISLSLVVLLFWIHLRYSVVSAYSVNYACVTADHI